MSLDLPVGTVEQVGYEGADFVAERGFCGGEGRLGDQFVMLETKVGFFVLPVSLYFFYFFFCAPTQVEVGSGLEEVLTRTVLRTEPNLGKSDTPLPRVSTEDSRRARDVRRDATQSLYVDGAGECDIAPNWFSVFLFFSSSRLRTIGLAQPRQFVSLAGSRGLTRRGR